MDKIHDVEILELHGHHLSLNVDGQQHTIDLSLQSPAIASATPLQREVIEVSPSGYGLRWPLLDEDLSIDGLLHIEHQRPHLHRLPEGVVDAPA